MSLRKIIALTSIATIRSLSLSGEEVHCLGDRAHVVKYTVAGEPNDGSSLEGIENAILSVEPAPMHAAKCDVRLQKSKEHTPSGDKFLCYGANQDPTCTSAKEDIPLQRGVLECKDCFVAATADVFYKLNFTWHSVHSVEVGIKNMHLLGSASVHAHAPENTPRTLVTGTKALSTWSKTLIDLHVGCPVCVKLKVTVATPTSLTYEVELKDQANITIGAALDFDLGERSVKWDHVDGWTWPKHEKSITVKPLSDGANMLADVDVKLTLDTALQIDIDHIIWYHMQMTPTLNLTARANGSVLPTRGAEFCLKGDTSLIIDHEADFHWHKFLLNKDHHWGPVQDYAVFEPFDECKHIGNITSAIVV